jgi:hypothetical protein
MHFEEIVMIIKLAASSKQEFGRRLLKGAPHLTGRAMTELQALHNNATSVIKAKAKGDWAEAAHHLGSVKDWSKFSKDTLAKNKVKEAVKKTMGSKLVSKTVAP